MMWPISLKLLRPGQEILAKRRCFIHRQNDRCSCFWEEEPEDYRDDKAEEIKIIAIDYNRAVEQHEWHKRDENAEKQSENGARYIHALKQLERIEKACNELAASFEEAHPFALDMLNA